VRAYASTRRRACGTECTQLDETMPFFFIFKTDK
jgi:hypothetical protein